MWYILALAFLHLSQSSSAKSKKCEVPNVVEDVDWSKMGGTWYDVIDIAPAAAGVDLFDWLNITVTDRGFRTEINEWTCGNGEKGCFTDQFDRIRPGVYRQNPDSERNFISATIKAAWPKHHLREDLAMVDQSYNWEYFFVTDYESYFIPIMCTDAGWISCVKTRRTRLDLETLVKIWNALSAVGTLDQIHPKDDGCRGSEEELCDS